LTFIYVGLGGFIGAVGRYTINLFFVSFFGFSAPFSTMFVNVLGSLAMGILFYLTSNNVSDFYKLFFITGILGGFTTFSAFSLDSIQMLFNKDFLNFIIYVSSSVSLSLFFLYLGFSFARSLSL